MTASMIAKMLSGKRAGKRWQCKCPVTSMHQHGDRNRSLSVWESDSGWVRMHCFCGCTRDEILAAMGLRVRDLALRELERNPEWEKQRRNEERLKLLQRQHGLAIMAQSVIPEERKYWQAVERNIAKRGRALRDRIYPHEKEQRERERTVQRILKEYGADELWNCLPQSLFTPRHS